MFEMLPVVVVLGNLTLVMTDFVSLCCRVGYLNSAVVPRRLGEQ